MSCTRPIFLGIGLIILAAFAAFPLDSAFAGKKTLVLGLQGEPMDGFDPIMGWGRYGNPLFQSTLLSRDNGLNIINDLAQTCDLSADGRVWTITLKKGVKFSDGTPLTANDAAFTFNQASRSGGKADLSNLDKAVAVSSHALELHLKNPDATFVNRLITLGIVPEHAYSRDYGRHPVGSGPFRMVSWMEGEQMIAETNPFYYGKKPYFNRLVFLYAGDDTMLAAARAGKLDMIVVPPHLGKLNIKGMHRHRVKSVDNRGLMFPMVKDTGKTHSNGARIGNIVTADPAIRRAINIAVCRQALVDGVLEGFGRPAYFICDNLPWDNAHNRFKDNRIKEAQDLLAQAGWKDSDRDGILEKNGIPAEFNLIYPSERVLRQGLALAVASMIQPLGLRAHVLGKSMDEIRRRTHSDVILYGWGSLDPMEMYHLYHSRLAGQGLYNPGFYANAAVDRYLDMAVQASDFHASLEYWQKAQWDGKTGCGPKGDAPWAWLVNLDHVYFVRDGLDIGLSRMEPHGFGWPVTANIREWKWED
ncbi:ABC transporter substrate-binding protein [Desulfospira joergensenii]|uniref:ABC transporter substrate-binding protein n=1 Tax=Desulfospira joergensenii TaxID=53329 RepID=UPI0003B3254B|nr:ABC transporter substrate-binding protein [Desulfospira joergensenii]